MERCEAIQINVQANLDDNLRISFEVGGCCVGALSTTNVIIRFDEFGAFLSFGKSSKGRLCVIEKRRVFSIHIRQGHLLHPQILCPDGDTVGSSCIRNL